MDAKAQATQGRVDQQQAHLTQLDQTTQDALNRATAAGKLAEGKFLYSMVLSDDSVKFKADSSKLSPEAQQRLTDFAEKLKATIAMSTWKSRATRIRRVRKRPINGWVRNAPRPCACS